MEITFVENFNRSKIPWGVENPEVIANGAKMLQYGMPTSPINGYTKIAVENEKHDFGTQIVDLAYGANNKFKYLTRQTGLITFSNAFFGGDPIIGTRKVGYFKISV